MRFKEGPRRWKKSAVVGSMTLRPKFEGDILQCMVLLEYDTGLYQVVKLESQRLDSSVWHRAVGEPEHPVNLMWDEALVLFIKRTVEEQR